MRFAGSAPAVEAMGLFSGFDPSALGSQAQKGRSLQKQTAMQAESMTEAAKLEAEAMIESAKLGAAATRSAGQAAGNASMVSGIASGISSFAGPIASGLKGPGITSYDQIPAAGLRGSAAGGGPNAYLGTGGRYGSFVPPTPVPGKPGVYTFG